MEAHDVGEKGVSDGLGGVGVRQGMKWQYLLKRSTTERMTVLPWTLGSASMKSMPMSAHITDGTDSGCSSPADLRWSDLYC
jgi:hypothetical protein